MCSAMEVAISRTLLPPVSLEGGPVSAQPPSYLPQHAFHRVAQTEFTFHALQSYGTRVAVPQPCSPSMGSTFLQHYLGYPSERSTIAHLLRPLPRSVLRLSSTFYLDMLGSASLISLSISTATIFGTLLDTLTLIDHQPPHRQDNPVSHTTVRQFILSRSSLIP